MSQTTRKLTITWAGLALASLPIFVNAQTTPPRQHTRPAPTTRHHQTVDHNSPQYHLDAAKRLLNSINSSTMKGEARTQLDELRMHFTQLEAAWAAQMPAGRSGAAEPGAGYRSGTTARGTTGAGTSTTNEQSGSTRSRTSRSGEPTQGAGDWMNHYSAIDQILDRMLGANASVSGSATSGTSGRRGANAGASATSEIRLDASTRTKLMEFRKHLNAFHVAAMSATGTPRSAVDRDVPDVPPDVPDDAARAPGSDPDVQPTPHPATPDPAAPIDRNAQIRVAPGQTIELNAAGNIDSATIARLSGMINEMLRGGAAGTTGSAGATSTATGTVCVDRAKLEQLRTVIDGLRAPQQ
jgi:hypothetical protein